MGLSPRDQRLAEHLFRGGFVAEATLRECLDLAAGRADGLAAVLRERGLVDAAVLARALQEVLRGESATGEKEQRRIGPYLLERELGRGSYGAVFLARHAEGGPPCALKLLTSAQTPEDRARFFQEAEAAWSLDHPHLLEVLDRGQAGNLAWIALELAPGGSLEERLRVSTLPVEEARALGLALADALTHAHERGVLHRDLKPANVLYDDLGRPRLSDLGLAKRLDAASLTMTGTFLGTPAYMPPEQARDAKRADVRSDVYGLAAILYHALAGRPPVLPRGDFASAVQAIEHEAPPSLRSLRPEVPAPLAAAIERALSKDPAARFASMLDFLRALERAGTARPGAPAPRGRRAPAFALPLALVLVAGGAYLGSRLSRPPAEGTEEDTPAPSASVAASSPASPPTPAPPTLAPGLDLARWGGLQLQVVWTRQSGDLSLALSFEVAAADAQRLDVRLRRVRAGMLLTPEQARTMRGDRGYVADTNPGISRAPVLRSALGATLRMRLDGPRVVETRGLEELRPPFIQFEAPHHPALRWLLSDEGWPALWECLLRPHVDEVVPPEVEGGRPQRLVVPFAGPHGSGTLSATTVRLVEVGEGVTLQALARQRGRAWPPLHVANGLGPGLSLEQDGTDLALVPLQVLEIPRDPPPSAPPAPVRVEPWTPVYAEPYGAPLGVTRDDGTYFAWAARDGWRPLQWGGGVGWVADARVRPDPQPEPSIEVIRVKDEDPLNVRNQPDDGSLIMGGALVGQRFALTGERGNWVGIRYEDHPYWVFGHYTRQLKPNELTPPR
ncbi:MAG: protein kinase [Planctomycetota bacterium]